MLAARAGRNAPHKTHLEAKNEVAGKFIGRTLAFDGSTETDVAQRLYLATLLKAKTIDKIEKLGGFNGKDD